MVEQKPITLHRKPSDFQRRSDVILGLAATCCSCCCLHWVGAAIGAGMGFVKGWRQLPAQQTKDIASRKIILNALIGGIICAVMNLIALLFVANQHIVEMIGISLVFVPSLALLPACLFVFFGGYWAYRVRGELHFSSTLENPIDLASAMVWRGFWYSMAGGLIGYLAMFALPLLIGFIGLFAGRFE
jgi:hypothetical protein